jgi:hypothetical protein
MGQPEYLSKFFIFCNIISYIFFFNQVFEFVFFLPQLGGRFLHYTSGHACCNHLTSALNVGVKTCCEMSLPIYQQTRRQTPEHFNLLFMKILLTAFWEVIQCNMAGCLGCYISGKQLSL